MVPISIVRVAVCVDMEGVTGIDRYEQCFPAWKTEYREGVRNLVGDVRTTVEAALGAGAREVVVADWHYLGRNIPKAAFPDLPIRRLWQGGRPRIGPEAFGRADAAVLIGMHAGAGNPQGFLSHTFWKGMSLLLEGVPLSEAALWGLALGGLGIPVAVVAGDQRAAEEAARLLPGVRTVGVKAGTSRTSVILRKVEDARDELAGAIRSAIGSPPPPLAHPFPATATIRYSHRSLATAAAKAGVGDRSGERDVSAHLGSVHDLMPFLARGLLATRLGAGPRFADRLLPYGEGPASRAWTACVRGLGGWIERRTVRAWARERPELYPPVRPHPG